MVETAEATGLVPLPEPVEAVIISGPRRGEIVQLPEHAVPEVSGEELEMLNGALDEVIAAIERLSAEIRATTAAFRGGMERLDAG